MKTLVTLLYSAAFMLAGVLIAKSTSNLVTAAQTIQAATPNVNYVLPTKVGAADLPLDLQLDLVKHDTVFVTDTIYPTFLSQDVVIEGRKQRKTRKTTKRHKDVVLQDTMPHHIKNDTLYVPSIYIIVPLEKLDSAKTIVEPMFTQK